MVLFFSGTGNSRHTAQRIAARLSDQLVCVNDRIKAGDVSPVQTEGRLIIVTPTYAWRIPRVVEDWLRRTPFPGTAQVWFVMTCGSEIGNAAKFNRALCAEMGIPYMGTAGVVMPENYIAMFHAPDADEAREIVARADPAIQRAASLIAAGQEFPPPRRNLYDRFMSGPVNPAFYRLCVKAKAFRAGDGCTGCGTCARLCPTNNISLREGKPVWGDRCTHCMACICYCPTEAIEYGKKSVGQPRYHIEGLFDGPAPQP